ncbi:MAG: hypothetical protein ABSA75_03905 [Candidatus Bathyarchaeia archaeon]|jgi:mannitol-specific phosphotransferase system IIBC component
MNINKQTIKEYLQNTQINAYTGTIIALMATSTATVLINQTIAFIALLTTISLLIPLALTKPTNKSQANNITNPRPNYKKEKNQRSNQIT